jgi:hypothetical protein
VLIAPEGMKPAVMSTIPIVIILFVVSRTGVTELAQAYVSLYLSVLGNENVITYPFQVSTIVVGEEEENDTTGAVGKDPQVPMHVKVGVYESAWALGTPIATHSTVMMVHNDFRISETFLSVSSVKTATLPWACFTYRTLTSNFTMLKRKDLPHRGTPHTANNCRI